MSRLSLHTRQSNCEMDTFSAALPSTRLNATACLPSPHGGWRRDPGACDSGHLALPIERVQTRRRAKEKSKNVRWRRQSDTRLTRPPMVAQGTVDRFCRGSMWLWNPQSGGSTSSSHVRPRLNPLQGSLRPSCDRIIATVPGPCTKAGALSARQKRSLIRTRRGRTHVGKAMAMQQRQE